MVLRNHSSSSPKSRITSANYRGTDRSEIVLEISSNHQIKIPKTLFYRRKSVQTFSQQTRYVGRSIFFWGRCKIFRRPEMRKKRVVSRQRVQIATKRLLFLVTHVACNIILYKKYTSCIIVEPFRSAAGIPQRKPRNVLSDKCDTHLPKD